MIKTNTQNYSIQHWRQHYKHYHHYQHYQHYQHCQHSLHSLHCQNQYTLYHMQVLLFHIHNNIWQHQHLFHSTHNNCYYLNCQPHTFNKRQSIHHLHCFIPFQVQYMKLFQNQSTKHQFIHHVSFKFVIIIIIRIVSNRISFRILIRTYRSGCSETRPITSPIPSWSK